MIYFIIFLLFSTFNYFASLCLFCFFAALKIYVATILLLLTSELFIILIYLITTLILEQI